MQHTRYILLSIDTAGDITKMYTYTISFIPTNKQHICMSHYLRIPTIYMYIVYMIYTQYIRYTVYLMRFYPIYYIYV